MGEYSSPARVAGKVVREVSIGGVKYTLSEPIKVATAAEEEQVIIARRLDMLTPLMRSVENFPKESRSQIRVQYMQLMVCGIARPEEWTAYYQSLWRDAFRFWSSLCPTQKANRELLDGVRWAFDVLNAATNEERDSAEMAIRLVSQEDELKNSSGSTAPEATSSPDSPATPAT